MGLNVCRAKASGLELMHFGSKLDEAGCTANNEDFSISQPRGRLLLKTHLASARELPEGDVQVLGGLGKQVFTVL